MRMKLATRCPDMFVYETWVGLLALLGYGTPDYVTLGIKQDGFSSSYRYSYFL